ncbi:MAG: hypothetical protein QOJ39_3236 [Candidatus Eremiobacteraeota bacterium]|nr:hypothetical protein [Candidatus Eremiobacteraeota bacterium]
MLMMTPCTCACGHGPELHDLHGCAAFLGAFAETAGRLSYCSCKQVPAASGRPVPLQAIVATVRVRERAGSAIGVCEAPPVLELGASAQDVLARVLVRLREAIAPAGGGVPQCVMVVRDGEPPRAEPLR